MITSDLISKWVVKYKNWNLAITENKEVYDITTCIKLVEYWNNGSISYRMPRTTNKISVKLINANCVKKSVVIKEYCPF